MSSRIPGNALRNRLTNATTGSIARAGLRGEVQAEREGDDREEDQGDEVEDDRVHHPRAHQVEHGRAGDQGPPQVVLHEDLVQPVEVLHVERPVQPQPVLCLLDLRLGQGIRVGRKAAGLEDLAPRVVVHDIPGGKGHEAERPPGPAGTASPAW